MAQLEIQKQVIKTNFFFFLGLQVRHMEVPRPGVESEPQPRRSHTHLACDLHHTRSFNPLSEARERTPILMDPRRVSYCWATRGTPRQTSDLDFVLILISPDWTVSNRTWVQPQATWLESALKISGIRSSLLAPWLMNPLGTMRFRVRFLASLSGLRIQHCRKLWCRSQTRLRCHVTVAVV